MGYISTTKWYKEQYTTFTTIESLGHTYLKRCSDPISWPFTWKLKKMKAHMIEVTWWDSAIKIVTILPQIVA